MKIQLYILKLEERSDDVKYNKDGAKFSSSRRTVIQFLIDHFMTLKDYHNHVRRSFAAGGQIIRPTFS